MQQFAAIAQFVLDESGVISPGDALTAVSGVETVEVTFKDFSELARENAGLAARRLRAMGMKVFYHKRSRLTATEEEQLGGIVYVSREELLAKADFVSVHIPYIPENEKYIDADFLDEMQQGAYIINTSRGGILDEKALFENLNRGHLAGAALDVYRYEPVPPDCPLLDLDNIVWTPHTSGGRPEFMIRESEDVLTNVAQALKGETLEGQLSP